VKASAELNPTSSAMRSAVVSGCVQPSGRHLQPPAPDPIGERLPGQRLEQPVKMKWREAGDAGQRVQIERLVEVRVDVVHDAVDPGGVGPAFLHGANERPTS
jgi:hypothetical protein